MTIGELIRPMRRLAGKLYWPARKLSKKAVREIRKWPEKFDSHYQLRRHELLELFYRCNARLDYRQGCLRNKRDTPLIVSLTTTPARLGKVHLCIASLLRQTCKPDHVLLWISDTIKQESIPPSLRRLTGRGLEIRFCKDIRSYTKIIPALREYPHAVIVTADDDRFYPANWLQELFEAYQRDPGCIICHRAHLMTLDDAGNLDSYNDWDFMAFGVIGPSTLLFPTGTCGVLYPPGSLHNEVLNEKVFMDICLTGDDIWLKAMSLLNGVACKKVAPDSRYFPEISDTQANALWNINITGNDQMVQRLFARYGLYDVLKQNQRAERAKNQ